MTTRIPTVILGGTGYVAGELLRLVLGHPQLEVAGILSDSQPGEPVAKAFPHLAPVLGELRFRSEADITQLVTTLPTCALFSAAPHGSAPVLGRLSDRHGRKPVLVGSQLGTLAGLVILGLADRIELL
ncbi:MAG: hypothetical protein ACK5F5_07600, partial [Gammaproteobacteria bacterium]